MSTASSESFRGTFFFFEHCGSVEVASFPLLLEEKEKRSPLGRRGSQVPGTFSRLYNILCSISGWSQKHLDVSVLTEAPYEAVSEQIHIPPGRTMLGPKMFSGFPAHQGVLGLVLALSYSPVIAKSHSSTLLLLDLKRSHSTTPILYSLSGDPRRL